jgi:hypothetical protein
MTMHTPGPWNDERDLAGTISDTNGEEIAMTMTVGGYPEARAEERANARLIAAAPEMLVALQFAMENLELANPIVEHAGHVTSIPSAMRKASAAIAKATGA